MVKMSKDLQERSNAYRAELYQKLYAERPDVKRFAAVRNVLIWCLRIIFLANFFCAMFVMIALGDYSQAPIEIIRLCVGIFLLYVAGRTWQGAWSLWVLVLANLVQAGQYINQFYLLTDPIYWSNAPEWVIMYCTQLLFIAVLLPTAIFLSLPSSRRRIEAALEAEKAYIDMIAAEMPEQR